jgi:hypothetical protein
VGAEEDELWFSDRFNVDPVVLEDYGAYDISVVTDTPLFIDPFLLFTSEDDKYQALHEGMLEYLRFLKRKGSAPLTEVRFRTGTRSVRSSRTGWASPRTATLATGSAKVRPGTAPGVRRAAQELR